MGLPLIIWLILGLYVCVRIRLYTEYKMNTFEYVVIIALTPLISLSYVFYLIAKVRY